MTLNEAINTRISRRTYKPAAGLDPNATSELYALLSGLHNSGMTIICVSHDLAAAKTYATHILKLGEGKQLFFGKAVDFNV